MQMTEAIAFAVEAIIGVVALALAAWGAILTRAEQDAVERRRLTRAAKLNRWRRRVDAMMILALIASMLCWMLVALVIFY